VTRAHLSPIKCTKSFGGRGFAPDPTGGAYSAPPDPLAGFRGRRFAAQGAPLRGAGSAASRRGEGKGGEGDGAKGRGGEGRGGEGGRGSASPVSETWRRP
jgi:hypothetical protein